MKARDVENTLDMLTAICRRLMDRFHMSEQHASELAAEAVDALSEHYGGGKPYIRKSGPQTQVSGKTLRAEYDGTAHSREALQKKYGLSTSSFYRRLKDRG